MTVLKTLKVKKDFVANHSRYNDNINSIPGSCDQGSNKKNKQKHIIIPNHLGKIMMVQQWNFGKVMMGNINTLKRFMRKDKVHPHTWGGRVSSLIFSVTRVQHNSARNTCLLHLLSVLTATAGSNKHQQANLIWSTSMYATLVTTSNKTLPTDCISSISKRLKTLQGVHTSFSRPLEQCARLSLNAKLIAVVWQIKFISYPPCLLYFLCN